MPVGSFYFGACLPQAQKKRQAAAKNDDRLVWSVQPNAFACLNAALRDDVSKGWDSETAATGPQGLAEMSVI